MNLNRYTIDKLLDLGGVEFETFLQRPNRYKANGRSEEQMLEDRLWGDLAEFAFKLDTGANESGIKYEDLLLDHVELYGEAISGLVELKTIPRLDSKAATTAIQNYFLKHKPGDRKADYFVVYYADRVGGVITPFGLYRRGFANAIEVVWNFVVEETS